MLVVGKREAEEGTVSVRRLGVEKQETGRLDDIVRRLAEEAVPPDVKRARAA
jgi:threonyl-tRNA synthetase